MQRSSDHALGRTTCRTIPAGATAPTCLSCSTPRPAGRCDSIWLRRSRTRSGPGDCLLVRGCLDPSARRRHAGTGAARPGAGYPQLRHAGGGGTHRPRLAAGGGGRWAAPGAGSGRPRRPRRPGASRHGCASGALHANTPVSHQCRSLRTAPRRPGALGDGAGCRDCRDDRVAVSGGTGCQWAACRACPLAGLVVCYARLAVENSAEAVARLGDAITEIGLTPEGRAAPGS